MSERDVTNSAKRMLEQKIQLLEQEVKLLRVKLREKNLTSARPQKVHTETLPKTSLIPSDIGLIKNSWLISFGQYLLLESDKSNISSALERLGQLFELKDCSLWRINAPLPSGKAVPSGKNVPSGKAMPSSKAMAAAHSYQCLGRWQAEINVSLQDGEWVKGILQSGLPLCAGLHAGQPVTLLAEDAATHDITAPLRAINIVSSLLVPVVRFNQLEGFVVLHAGQTKGWYARDIDRLMFIVKALFTMYDRQQLVRQLSDRDARFNYAIEASNDGLWDWNILTGKIYFSRNYLRMLGYYYEELPGNLTALQDYFLHSDDAKMVLERYQAAIEKCETHVNLQFRMQHQSGKVLWIQSKAKFCEPDSNGRPTRCVGLNTDISAFINAQEELLAAKTQADMANKTKSEFLARMSHEIRTPMNAVIGLGYLFKDTCLDEQQKSYLSSLNSASDCLLHIINEVLDFSKIESGKVILEQANFDLTQLFEKMSRFFEISANQKTIRIIYAIQADVPRFLRGDSVRLSQIIGHLISNAIQYSATNEVIVGVKLQKANRKYVELEFSVTDSGVGMSAARLATVNESLQKHIRISDGGRSRFGLGICSHLIALMKGAIKVESAVNKGCCVSFTATFDNSHLGAKTLHNCSRDLKNIRALIVDDNVVARTVLASTAKNITIVADTAEDAEQALEKIKHASLAGQPFHFVLMDYRMPAMNGIEAAAAIKAMRDLVYSPHIIMVSAYHRDEIVNVDGSALYVDEFLSKPVSEARLFETLNDIINKDTLLQKISALTDIMAQQEDILNGLQVLVAEDNIVNQQVVRGVLKKKNIQVSIANNGVEALNLLTAKGNFFDLVLMDLEMPEMGGIEATRAIRKNNCAQNIPIVALTAQAMRGDRELCLAAGMNAYLTKPINPELLYNTLAEQVNLSRAKKTTHDSNP